METLLQYGKTNLRINLDDSRDVTAIQPKNTARLMNPVQALKDAFSTPIDSKPLKETCFI